MILFENRASTILFNTLSSLDIKGKFLLPLNICPIVPITFLKANIPFELIDIELENLCIDRNKVLEKIKNENISGVLFAHTFGIELDMENKYTKFEDYKQAIEEQIVIVKEHKEKLNKIYMENIPQEFHLGERFNTWRFSILSDKKDTILQEIFKHNLFASSHYKEVDYLFSDTIIHNSNANKISSQIVNLFNDLRFTQDMAFEVSKIVRKNL
jgi:dTDP-4-amino-4,6-dideoxygalactose transaminase